MDSHACHHVPVNRCSYSCTGVEQGLGTNRATNETPSLKPSSDANLKLSHFYDVAYRV